MTTTDCVVVGGGAAGLLCASTAARRGERVLLLEKMQRPGRKLLLTGKGRCNLTNNCDREAFLSAVRTNPRFLYSAWAAFPAQAVMDLFEQLGVPVKTERGNRVFPCSDRSADVVDALVGYAKNSGVHIRHARVTELCLQDGRVCGVESTMGQVQCNRVVVATGGISYPRTGSTGDGYTLASQAGHSIVPLRPSLIPIVTQETWCRDAMGLSLKNCRLRLAKEEKTVYEELGEMLFTHFGVSGPLVLSASAHMTEHPAAYRLRIDLKPALSEQQLDARLQRELKENSNRALGNFLRVLLPQKLIPVVLQLAELDPGGKAHQLTREQRYTLIRLLKGLPLTPREFRPIEEAVVTAGGVAVDEVSSKTMESRLVQGLYFAGEVLDLDAYTGGFNLQIAFSTGYLAGG